MTPNRQHYSRQGEDVRLPIEFFADQEKKYLRPQLLSEDAHRLSDWFVTEKKMSIHQLRKFYNYLLVIKQRIETRDNPEEEFKRQLPYIKMMKAMATYAEARKRATKNFKIFIEKQLDKVNQKGDFDAFCDLFEAIVAFATANKSRYQNR